MPNDAFVTFRIPSEVKRRLVNIADKTKRSMSQAFVLLLVRGMDVFDEDGYLIDTKARPKPKPKPKRKPEEPAEEAKPAKKRTSRQK